MKNRLRQIIEYYNLTTNSFSAKIGVNESTIRKVLSSGTSIQSNNLQKLSANFPNINLDWLITGRGSMFIGEKQPVPPTDPPVATDATPPQPSGDNIQAVIGLLQASITEKDRQITEKDRQISRLLSIIEGVTTAPKPPENP